jgi:predicted dehydrogenase
MQPAHEHTLQSVLKGVHQPRCAHGNSFAPASHFIPTILKAAVAARKYVFCEKPHGIDIPGLKVSMAAAEQAKENKLNLVSGLCWRYHPGVRETMKRVHDGAIGDIVAIQENYVGTPYIVRERHPGQSEMEIPDAELAPLQLALRRPDRAATHRQPGQGVVGSGRQTPAQSLGHGRTPDRLDPGFRDQFDHQAVIFEYDNGVRVFGFTRDQPECPTMGSVR